MGKKEFKHLSKSVKPLNYKIQLQPDLELHNFKGEELVDIEVKRECAKITINSLDIEISSVVFHSDTQVLTASDIVYKAEDETVTFKFPHKLPVGNAQLEIVFVGELNDKMKGFYRSKYTSLSGEERFCAVTQFEPTDARRAFPCWDEPAIKATFDITLIAPKDRVVLSNMDVLKQTDSETNASLQVVTFNRTPIMSTYLVAFVVGEFDYVEDKTTDGILVRVYTPLGKTEQGKFALEIALKTLPFYSDYFGIAYPLPKMDLIAIPDFAAGAMENWGLVTYRETCLLVDPNETAAVTKQYVALVVGHEIAHQWFGNLTTMNWWTHLWLNEGFASFIEYMCVDHCCPEYDIWTQFVTNDFTRALELDALGNSHPIEVPVGHPSEIDEIFDAISYSKGASVIRMLHEYLGDKDFRAGLHSYLTTFQYKNGSTEDLWDHLEKSSSKPVGRVMSTWTQQMGYPVVAVSSEQAQSKQILKISQKKFTADGSEDAEKRLWSVPITIATSKNPNEKELTTLLSDPDMVLFLDNIPEDAWIKLNLGQFGFYRTCYSPEMIQKLVPGIKSLSAVDRLGIENDMFALAMAGTTSTTNFLDVLLGYAEETNYTVWKDLDANLGHLSILLQNTSAYDKFKEFVRKIYKPIAENIGWDAKEDDNALTPMLRSVILRRLGKYGDADTIEECQRRFKAHVDGTESIPADLRAVVYSTVVSNGSVETQDELIKLFRNTTHMEEHNRIMRSMGSSDEAELITKALEFSLSDDVRSQDTVFAMAGCTGSYLGRKMTWQFTKDNWEVLYKRYDGGFLLSRLVMLSTENFATAEEAQDVESFFTAHKVPAAERTVKQSLERIGLNQKWLSRDGESVVEWLNKN
ncbi:puromycin-sensitive aminopeptidase-like [Hydractinia symbiolongicarpus]|uniref:puromycin-sensitive aminopeptidase-like n=1 Tax=Hydractinia symbiolongicarpus TaxID=13093 RepID=UPI00254BC468|nr:puromycin-sensitive aminopeptidase-like [Hydractinia symbiolongicarpus]